MMKKSVAKMKSKAYVAFLNRLATYKRDLDLVDILSNAKNIPKHIDVAKYPDFSGISQKRKDLYSYLNHLKSTVHEGVIKNVYEIMMLYFRNVIEGILKHGVDPIRVLGDSQQTMTLADIVKKGSWSALSSELAKTVIKNLESLKDTTKLADTLAKRLSIHIHAASLNAAKPYFEIRHLLVHNNGLPDEDFLRRYPSYITGGEITIQYKGVKAAIDAISRYVKEFDSELISKGILSNEDCQG